MLFAQQQLNHNYDDYNYRRAHLHNYIFQIKKPCTYVYGHPLFVKWDRGRSMIFLNSFCYTMAETTKNMKESKVANVQKLM